MDLTTHRSSVYYRIAADECKNFILRVVVGEVVQEGFKGKLSKCAKPSIGALREF